jgi:hypothetical protein
MAEEKTFFQYEDVTVTNARFMVASQTFAMNNITSVKASRQDPKRLWPIVLIVIGVLFAVAGSANVGIGLVIGGVSVVWLLMQKTMYHVMLTTAGGETSALSSKQREYIEKVVQALNEAIVARG